MVGLTGEVPHTTQYTGWWDSLVRYHIQHSALDGGTHWCGTTYNTVHWMVGLTGEVPHTTQCSGWWDSLVRYHIQHSTLDGGTHW